MVANATDREQQQEVTAVIEALIRDGHFMADLAGRFLVDWFNSLGLKSPPPLPAEFLLELSAVIRVSAWQRAGLLTEMNEAFPPAAELLQQLLDRLFENPLSFSFDPTACPAPLQRRVVKFWFEHCSWTATSVLGTDMIVHAIDDEALLDALADLLWQHRNLSSRGGATHARPQEK